MLDRQSRKMVMTPRVWSELRLHIELIFNEDIFFYYRQCFADDFRNDII